MTNRKKFLVINSHLEIVGGVEVYLQSLINVLRNKGYDVIYSYWCGSSNPAMNLVEANPQFTKQINLDDVEDFESFIETFNPEFILAQNIETRSLHEAILKHPSCAYFIHDYRDVCISGNKYWKYPKIKICERGFGLGCLAKYFVNGCGGINPITGFRRYIKNAKNIKVIRKYEKIFVASRHVKNTLVINKFQSSKIMVNPYFIDDHNRNKSFIKNKSQTGRLLFVGRVVTEKGLDHAIKAVYFLNKMTDKTHELIVVGDKCSRDKFQEMASKVGVAISFRGWLPKESIFQLMSDSDALIVSSIWPEPFGIVGIEACSNGLPIVGYRVGGIKDWLEHGVNGESPPENQIDAYLLGKSLSKVLGNKEYWNKLREGAFKKAQEFIIEKHIDGLMETPKEKI